MSILKYKISIISGFNSIGSILTIDMLHAPGRFKTVFSTRTHYSTQQPPRHLISSTTNITHT